MCKATYMYMYDWVNIHCNTLVMDDGEDDENAWYLSTKLCSVIVANFISRDPNGSPFEYYSIASEINTKNYHDRWK